MADRPGSLKRMPTFSTQGHGDDHKASELASMYRAVESTPTRDLRGELKKAGVALPADDDLKKLSTILNKALEDYRFNELGKDPSGSWFDLYRIIDEDGSGFITFDELQDVVRHKLRMKEKKMSENTLKALWVVLDADDSDQVHTDEMAGFLKSGWGKDGKPLKRAATFSTQGHGDDTKAAELAASYRALESTPTPEMRVELEKAGVSLPTDDELTTLSTTLNKALEDFRYKELGKDHSGSWFDIYRIIDEDGSGFVTFDELEDVIRHKLKMKEGTMSTNTIKALWCALDADDSNQAQTDEMAGFLKRGYDGDERGKALKRQTTFSTSGHGDDHKAAELAASYRALESTPTHEMRVELEKAGVSLPDNDALLSLSKMLNEALESYRYHHGKGRSSSWYDLYRILDADGSGFITFDELEDVTRHKCGLKERKISDNTLKALWCKLDEDDSNQIQTEEMAGFLKSGYDGDEKGKALMKGKGFSTQGRGDAHKAKELSQMNRALDSKPTSTIRSELETAGEKLPDDAEANRLSRLYNEALETVRYNQSLGRSSSWYDLYRILDADGSGFITFDELDDFTRHQLSLKTKSLSQNGLKALWCMLDADDSNQVQTDEMAGFLKRGWGADKRGKMKRQQTFSTQGRGDDHKAKELAMMSRALDTTPTDVMRAELKEQGVAIPGESELTAFSKMITKGLEDYRYKERKSGSGWYMFFKEFDEDNSGFITFDELQDVIRHKLGFKQKKMPESTVKSLWCAIDIDDSNQVMADEMAHFLKRASGKAVGPPPTRQPSNKGAGMRPPSRSSGRRASEGESSNAGDAAEDNHTKRATSSPPRASSPQRASTSHLDVRRLEERRRELRMIEKPLLRPEKPNGKMPEKPSAVRRKLLQSDIGQSPPAQKETLTFLNTYNSKYKRRMLDEMRRKLLATPIPTDNGGRLGGGRLLPLYESERLICRMEYNDTSAWQWPHAGSTAKGGRQGGRQQMERPMTMHSRPPWGHENPAMVSYVSRLDVLPTRGGISGMKDPFGRYSRTASAASMTFKSPFE